MKRVQGTVQVAGLELGLGWACASLLMPLSSAGGSVSSNTAAVGAGDWGEYHRCLPCPLFCPGTQRCVP